MEKRSMKPNRFEAAFDVLYLATTVVLGVWLLAAGQSAVARLFGAMALVLVAGDAFHLIPRVGTALAADPERFRRALGTGKGVTSVGMTLFYLMLWAIGILRFTPPHAAVWSAVIGILAAVRIVLCLLPQNRWADDSSTAAWNAARNVPFVLEGVLVAVLFFLHRQVAYPWMGLAIALSFAFYLPVVFWAKKVPLLGMLMLPKTCMYVWIIAMGFQ